MDGTSMATPHVAGLAALYIQKYGRLGIEQFRADLINSSTDLGASGFDELYGNGLINALELLGIE
jgi:subtilisin family serine protease